jgi:hypothetical protein
VPIFIFPSTVYTYPPPRAGFLADEIDYDVSAAIIPVGTQEDATMAFRVRSRGGLSNIRVSITVPSATIDAHAVSPAGDWSATQSASEVVWENLSEAPPKDYTFSVTFTPSAVGVVDIVYSVDADHQRADEDDPGLVHRRRSGRSRQRLARGHAGPRTCGW